MFSDRYGISGSSTSLKHDPSGRVTTQRVTLNENQNVLEMDEAVYVRKSQGLNKSLSLFLVLGSRQYSLMSCFCSKFMALAKPEHKFIFDLIKIILDTYMYDLCADKAQYYDIFSNYDKINRLVVFQCVW